MAQITSAFVLAAEAKDDSSIHVVLSVTDDSPATYQRDLILDAASVVAAPDWAVKSAALSKVVGKSAVKAALAALPVNYAINLAAVAPTVVDPNAARTTYLTRVGQLRRLVQLKADGVVDTGLDADILALKTALGGGAYKTAYFQ